MSGRKSQNTQSEKDLIRRYLVWCYKTTKEELDRIDRYFTQEKVDTFLLKSLKSGADYNRGVKDDSYKQLVNQFEAYMTKKYKNALKAKFSDTKHTTLNPRYKYLKNRLAGIEKAIVHFFGKKELSVFRRLYEEEMTQRILSAREHT